MKNSKKDQTKKIRRVKAGVIAMMISLFMSIPKFAYAAAGDPKIITGTIALLTAASAWVLVIAPIAGGLFGGYHAIRKSMSDDEMEIKKHQNMIKNSIIGVVVAISVSGIISFLSSFYS